MATYRKKTPGQGCVRHGMKRIVVSFDDDTFDEVRGFAVTRGISFGEAVRRLVEFGLIDMEEAA